MRKLLFVLALTGCGEPAYVFNCTCTAVCDSSSNTVSGQACDLESNAQAGVDEATASCIDQLDDGACAHYECGCHCDKTEEVCTKDE